MKIMNMFRIGIPPPQPLSQEDIIIIIIIITGKSNKILGKE